MSSSTTTPQGQTMVGYYRWHARIYDLTRWSFLFGRKKIIRWLPISTDAPITAVEVGCGTGYNLVHLAGGFSRMQVIGVDVSPDMLTKARQATRHWAQRVEFIDGYYQDGTLRHLAGKPDLILFSYALTMFNPGWEAAIRQAYEDLAPGGIIAVVDFHSTQWSIFGRWMGHNHVRMDGHLLPELEQYFLPLKCQIRSAYGGLWQYFLYVGQKPTP
jgi:S-adenosylmethionine-diacylgycerolhomoserine-N-methlytransferase